MARLDRARRPFKGVAPDPDARRLRGQVNLLCGHAMFFTQPMPRVGDELLCPSCRTASPVTAIEDEIRIRCTQCRYSRGFGQGRLTADTYASKHATTRRHKIEVVQGSTVLTVMGAHHGQMTLGDVK